MISGTAMVSRLMQSWTWDGRHSSGACDSSSASPLTHLIMENTRSLYQECFSARKYAAEDCRGLDLDTLSYSLAAKIVNEPDQLCINDMPFVNSSESCHHPLHNRPKSKYVLFQYSRAFFCKRASTCSSSNMPGVTCSFKRWMSGLNMDVASSCV